MKDRYPRRVLLPPLPSCVHPHFCPLHQRCPDGLTVSSRARHGKTRRKELGPPRPGSGGSDPLGRRDCSVRHFMLPCPPASSLGPISYLHAPRGFSASLVRSSFHRTIVSTLLTIRNTPFESQRRPGHSRSRQAPGAPRPASTTSLRASGDEARAAGSRVPRSPPCRRGPPPDRCPSEAPQASVPSGSAPAEVGLGAGHDECEAVRVWRDATL